jgi:hypothetical protein
MASSMGRGPAIIDRQAHHRPRSRCLSALVTEMTFFLGSIPDSTVMTGISLRGRRASRELTKSLLREAEKSRMSRASEHPGTGRL